MLPGFALRDVKIVGVSVCALALMGGCGGCGSSSASSTTSAPTQSELAAAKIAGHWQLTVVVDPYTGPPPPSTDAFPPGHRGTDEVVFVSACTAPGACTLQLWGSAGPDPSQQAFYRFYSSASDLQGPPAGTPMTQSGASYTQVIPVSGFGGFKCPPSRTVARPEQRLTLTVADASRSGSAWTATKLTGTETFLAGWGCGASGFTGWTVGHLAITGRPG